MTLLWDVRSDLEANEAKTLQGIIDKNKKKKSYYIFKHANWTDNSMTVMKSTYMLRSDIPPKMLGTILWKVDNTKGTFEKLWELPLDVLVDSSLLDPHSSQDSVIESALGMKPAIVLS